MMSLVSHLPGDSDKPEKTGAEYWKSVLSLMIKLMGRPTFYEVWGQYTGDLGRF